MTTRPFRFGTKATKAASGKEWADLARQAETLGYDSFQIDDHFGAMLAATPAFAQDEPSGRDLVVAALRLAFPR